MKMSTTEGFCVYPQEDLDGLRTGGSCCSTWNIFSNNSEASIAIIGATEVLSKAQCMQLLDTSVKVRILKSCIKSIY